MDNSFSTRLARAIADPWVLLVSALGGGVAWAVQIPPFDAAAIGFGMLGVAATTTAMLKGGGEPKPDDGLPELHKGTQQARLTEALEGYLSDLRQMRGTKLPDSVTDSAIEALVATDGAHAAALRVAVAADKLDEAIARSERIAGSGGVAVPSGVRDSIQRMGERRAGLLAKLDKAVSEVAEVYTKLLELTATVDTMDVGGPQLTEVETVNTSLDSLRTAFAELERDASRPPVA